MIAALGAVTAMTAMEGDVHAERRAATTEMRTLDAGDRKVAVVRPSRSTFGSGSVVAPERLPRGADLGSAPLSLSKAPTLTGRMIVSELDEIANEFGAQLGTLTLEVVDLDFDLHKKRARMRVDTGKSALLGFAFDGDMRVVHGVARVDAAIDLRIGTNALSLTLPTFELVPQSLDGRRWVEFRLPLVERAF